MSETSTIVTPALRALSRIPGVIAFRLPASTGSYRIRGAGTGAPDIGCVVNGRALFLEAKKPGEEPSADQLKWHEDARRAGAVVVVVRSVAEAVQAASALL